ncbi:TPA: hypothetical protein OMS93_001377 [Enterobacter hormaechei]|jgi:hypothetical protein|uniref:hypothetical protein n=1 Tax=Enterobacteriaceae TaxID=543 RepID=UPI0009392265|nr:MULTISPECIES: hypothetical protein [Enterobacteriaceae]MCY9797557.1 hypothetical protein [Citrobacter braakii]HCR0445290.1 hypothetical protein [Enterobacter hormaechei]
MSKIITLSYTNNFKPISGNQSQSLRIHCVSVRLNKEELELLNASRGDKRKGEWLRMASLQKLPPAIPAINLEVWQSLTTISQKLNKLIDHLDTKSSNSELTKTEIFAVKKQIKELRSCLTASAPSIR